MDDNDTEQIDYSYFPGQSSKKSSLPIVAGVLLIIASIFALITWIPTLYLDVGTLEDLNYIDQFQQIDPSITPEQALGFLTTCAVIGIIVSIFPLLGGILSLKRKVFGIAVACSIIGLFSIGVLFFSSILCLIALILLVISRKEYNYH